MELSYRFGNSACKSVVRGYRGPHPPLPRSPFPYEGKALTRRKVSKSSNIGRGTSHIRRAKRSRTGDVRSPLRSGIYLPLIGKGEPLAVDEVTMDKCAHCCKLRPRSVTQASAAKGCSRSRAPAGRSPSPAGVGWRGSPLRTDSRRGQRLPTDIRLPPAPRVSAGLRFAVRSY